MATRVPSREGSTPLPRPDDLLDECERELDEHEPALTSDERRLCSHLIACSRKALLDGMPMNAAVYMHWLGLAVGDANGLRRVVSYRRREMQEIGEYLLNFRSHTEREIRSDRGREG